MAYGPVEPNGATLVAVQPSKRTDIIGMLLRGKVCLLHAQAKIASKIYDSGHLKAELKECFLLCDKALKSFDKEGDDDVEGLAEQNGGKVRESTVSKPTEKDINDLKRLQRNIRNKLKRVIEAVKKEKCEADEAWKAKLKRG